MSYPKKVVTVLPMKVKETPSYHDFTTLILVKQPNWKPLLTRYCSPDINSDEVPLIAGRISLRANRGEAACILDAYWSGKREWPPCKKQSQCQMCSVWSAVRRDANFAGSPQLLKAICGEWRKYSDGWRGIWENTLTDCWRNEIVWWYFLGKKYETDVRK